MFEPDPVSGVLHRTVMHYPENTLTRTDFDPNEAGLPPAVPRQADTDDQVVAMWLSDKSVGTRKGYLRNLEEFFASTGGKPLGQVTVRDLVAFLQANEGRARSTQNRKAAAVKSLLSFAHDIGYIRFNPGRAVRVKKASRNLNERILTESEVHRLIGAGRRLRDRVILRAFYASGARVSELAGLRWGDLAERIDRKSGRAGGRLTLHGKGDEYRTVLVSPETWRDLEQLQDRARDAGYAGEGDPVFRSQKGGAMDPSALWRIIRNAAVRAGIDKAVSPHWMRHAHISHALDRGAPVHLVRQTAGHKSLATTSQYSHARPDDSSGLYLSI